MPESDCLDITIMERFVKTFPEWEQTRIENAIRYSKRQNRMPEFQHGTSEDIRYARPLHRAAAALDTRISVIGRRRNRAKRLTQATKQIVFENKP